MRPRTLIMLFGGILFGRIAAQEFPSGLLQFIDLATYIGLAFGLAWAWRSWARRAIEDRRREALKRQGGTSHKRRRSTRTDDDVEAETP